MTKYAGQKMDLDKERVCYATREIQNGTINEEPETPLKPENEKRKKQLQLN